ncbi:uncharacterized protein [Watersipora subatra]|uniref:uncharacterized protein n=1 Tax=Watersipora subatra TaxID=2589382 RepID=UPI00355AE869
MCFAYIFYYPRQNLTTCSSSPRLYNDPTDPVYAELSVNASTENTIFAIDQVSDWTKDTVAVLQNGFDKTPHFSFCYRENYIPYEGMHSLINRDGYPEMERKEQRKCYSKEGEADANSAGSIQAAFYSLSLIFVVTFY